jgi:hypothetical protein
MVCITILEHNMNTTKTRLGLLSLMLASALFSNCLYAKKPKGDHKGPPKEAIEACVDKSEGDVVTFTTPRGHELTGVCTTMKEIMVAVPEDHEHGERPDSSERPTQ